MWPAAGLQDRLILLAGQAFFAPSGVCRRANGRSRVDQASNPQHSGPAEPLFRAADGPVLPLSFSLGMARDRKSVVWGKSVSVRVGFGGRRIIKKKKHNTYIMLK